MRTVSVLHANYNTKAPISDPQAMGTLDPRSVPNRIAIAGNLFHIQGISPAFVLYPKTEHHSLASFTRGTSRHDGDLRFFNDHERSCRD
ncbi:hypothetical protein FHX11_000379 [Rhizobium sp. BK602]|nr:hypothetical protein [Rhizobium sp. BK602]